MLSMGASVELLPDEATPSAGAPDMNCSLVISVEPEDATPSAITVSTFLPLERSSAGIGDSTFTNESQVSSSSLSLLGQAKSVALMSFTHTYIPMHTTERSHNTSTRRTECAYVKF
uniref:Uncharacterized protein n=1 Tax=Glossina pallidipes TaxID=7398 RepID=A0A1A9ZSU2_GLOPL